MSGLQGGIVEASCAQDAPGPRCIKYFTAMGNRWSSKGDYPNTVEWYSRAAEQGGWTYAAAESELTGARTMAAFEASQNGAATPAPLRDNGRDLAMLRLAEEAYLDAARDGLAR